MEKDCVLEVLNIRKIFPDGSIALDNVSFSIFRGEFTVLAGKNGSGKSVLMTLIAALEEPTDGKITLHNAKPGLVFQEAESQILGETPFEDVSFGAKNCGLKKDALSKKVEWALEQTDLYYKKDANARMMSGGEKRRLAVSGILAMDKDLLIFDEPFANLDFDGVKSVCEILRQLKDDGRTVIVLTHELEKILALADRFIILNKGKILFNGTPSDGLKLNLEDFGIRNPLREYKALGDLLWL